MSTGSRTCRGRSDSSRSSPTVSTEHFPAPRTLTVGARPAGPADELHRARRGARPGATTARRRRTTPDPDRARRDRQDAAGGPAGDGRRRPLPGRGPFRRPLDGRRAVAWWPAVIARALRLVERPDRAPARPPRRPPRAIAPCCSSSTTSSRSPRPRRSWPICCGQRRGLTVVATSRGPLRVSGEHEFAVPPLGLPVAQAGRWSRDRSTSRRPPAVALFVDRATAARSDFRLTDDERRRDRSDLRPPRRAAACHRTRRRSRSGS